MIPYTILIATPPTPKPEVEKLKANRGLSFIQRDVSLQTCIPRDYEVQPTELSVGDIEVVMRESRSVMRNVQRFMHAWRKEREGSETRHAAQRSQIVFTSGEDLVERRLRVDCGEDCAGFDEAVGMKCKSGSHCAGGRA